MNAKPIETIYNGYRFRSRLEARWAVFFDTIGIKYQYEPEGFDLGGGVWYLPDFYLPDWNCWLEIKPAFPKPEELAKVVLLRHHLLGAGTGQHLTHQPCYILCGSPGAPRISLQSPDSEVWWSLDDGYMALQPIAFTGSVYTGAGHLFTAKPATPEAIHSGEAEIHTYISVFAITDHGLDFWPFYLAELDQKHKQAFIDSMLSKDKRKTREGRNLVKAMRKGKLYMVPCYPKGVNCRIYLGGGIDYSSPELLNAYAAARQARFGQNGRG